MGGGTASRCVRRLRAALVQHVRTGHCDGAMLDRTTTHPRARAPDPPRPAQFDGKPFNKGSMAASVIATVAGGAGVICFAAFFQNKKHGFIK